MFESSKSEDTGCSGNDAMYKLYPIAGAEQPRTASILLKPHIKIKFRKGGNTSQTHAGIVGRFTRGKLGQHAKRRNQRN